MIVRSTTSHNTGNWIRPFGPEYAYPEVFDEHCNFEPKIVHLAKDNSKYQQ